MKKNATLLILLCLVFALCNQSFADNGDNGVRTKKGISKKVSEKIAPLQINWNFESIASIQQVSFVRSLDNNLPAFTTEVEQTIFIKNHKKLVILNWLIPEPKVEATYIIERGTFDYNDFVEIGRIEPSQRNCDKFNNSFMDTEAPIGLYQYRIVEKTDCITTAEFTPQTNTHFIAKPNGMSLNVSVNQ